MTDEDSNSYLSNMKEMVIPRYEVINVVAVPGNQIMQYGAPEGIKKIVLEGVKIIFI